MNIIFTEAILLRSLALFLLLGSVAGLLAGAMMMWRPEWLTRLSQQANSWVSTRQLARPLERSVNLENWFYRNSYWSGGVLLAGAIYIVYIFTAHIGRTSLLSGLASMHLVPPVLLEPVLDTLVLVFLAGALLALIIGLFLIFRPSMLRDLELGANQRISLRKTLKPLEMQHANLDQLVFRNIQLAGVLLLCGSLYTLVALAFWLGR
jgi:hypothetical protein